MSEQDRLDLTDVTMDDLVFTFSTDPTSNVILGFKLRGVLIIPTTTQKRLILKTVIEPINPEMASWLRNIWIGN